MGARLRFDAATVTSLSPLGEKERAAANDASSPSNRLALT
jgi:hypothetical protein